MAEANGHRGSEYEFHEITIFVWIQVPVSRTQNYIILTPAE
jgi:hypothetical protein